MAGRKRHEGHLPILINHIPRMPLQVFAAGAHLTPLPIEALPAAYKALVLASNPFAEDVDLIEAYLGYGPCNTPNYKQWSRMKLAELKLP